MIVTIGGPTPKADLSKITITRGREVIDIDLSRVLKDGDRSGDVLLKSGDLIHIPPTASSEGHNIFVIGDVRTPGAVAYTEEITVFEAITMSGGLAGDTIQAQVEIIGEI